MIEPTITAEDLTLYALNLLEGDERAHVEAMLRKSTAAREELASIRGDLAMFAMGAEQHTPPVLTRQRLLKQVARERRTVPVDVPVLDNGAVISAHTFKVDREAAGRDRPDARPAHAAPQRMPPAQDAEDAMDPVAPSTAPPPKTIQTRTFASRTQQMRAMNAQQAEALQRVADRSRSPGVPRATRDAQPTPPEPVAESFSAGAASFAGEPASFAADRQTFPVDPHVFPREARSLPTSATAHSVTMFEQHFAAETVQAKRESDLPPDPEVYSGRRRTETDALEDVQDAFVPSGAVREESFGFSSYRDREATEPTGSSFARWMGWTGWAIAAAVTVAAVFALRDDFNLREQVSQQQSALAATEASASKAETVMQTLQSPASQQFLLAGTNAAPAPSGRVAYLPERGTLVFQGSNLEALQPYKTYELWLIPAGQGRQPVPAGLFKPDAHGYASVVLPQIPKGLVAGNFGVTIEDEGGSGTPTLPILMVGQQT